VIDLDISQRASRHRRLFRVGWILHHCHAATVLDGPEPSRAVIQGAAEDNADNTRPVNVGSGPKQRIDCRSKSIFFGSLCEADSTQFKQQVMIRRSDINLTVLN
jgi:hypothetical protein